MCHLCSGEPQRGKGRSDKGYELKEMGLENIESGASLKSDLLVCGVGIRWCLWTPSQDEWGPTPPQQRLL